MSSMFNPQKDVGRKYGLYGLDMINKVRDNMYNGTKEEKKKAKPLQRYSEKRVGDTVVRQQF